MRDSNLTKICLLKLSDVTYISRVHRCANTFATCNYDVTVISIAPRIASKSNNYPYRNVRIFILSRILPGRIFLPVRAMEGFLRMLYKAFCAKSEVYMPHNWEALLIAYIVTRFNGAKLVYNADELEFDRNFQGNRFIISLKNRLRMFSDAFICWRCNAVIAADYARAKVIQKAYGLKRIDVVRNTPLAWHGESDNRIRRTLNLNSDTIIMLYQGMIDYGRGIEICIEALSTLNIGNVHFVLLGFSTESYRIKIEAIANKLCVAEFVHFLPPVPWFDLLDWTASADISMVLIENT